jgi:hypothetical protein
MPGKQSIAGPCRNVCGAKLPDGSLCTNTAEPGKKRCRSHGGAPGVGAPKGNRNAQRHGLYSAEFKKKREMVNAIVADADAFLKGLKIDS